MALKWAGHDIGPDLGTIDDVHGVADAEAAKISV